MGIISVEQMDRLYWLGRYTERVYTTLRIFSRSFDTMLDELDDSYQEFCELIDIPNIYSDKEDFRIRYPFDGRNVDSIASNLDRAYDNALVLRETIGSEALSYIQLAVYEMERAKQSESPLIELQNIMDNLLAFWGIADDQIDSPQIRNIIKAGKRMERIDLYARLGVDRGELLREVNRMSVRIERSGLAYSEQLLEELKKKVSLTEVGDYEIVDLVERILS